MYAKQPEQEANAAFVKTDSITGNTAWSVKYQYDDNGNIISTTDAKGVSVTATYDNFNRLKLRNYSDDTPDVNFYYDGKGLGTMPNYAKGKTTKVTSSVSETLYTSFDNLGQIKSSQQITNGVTYNFLDYSYNLSGNLISQAYPSGRIVVNTLDADGDIAKVESQKDVNSALKIYANNIKYNAFGGVEQVRLGNGKFETTKYNNRLQVTQIGLGYSATDKGLLKIDYDYGTETQNNGSLREQKINYNGLLGEIKQNYVYDDLNRVQSATETFNNGTQSWKQAFSYDRFGNRRFDAANTSTLGQNTNQNVANPTINTSDNRMSSGQGYAYDKSGNLTQDAEGKRYIYDAENHQTSYFNSGNSSTTADANYQYDGNGTRIRKLVGQIETIFVYNALGQMVAEYSNQLPIEKKTSYLTTDHLGSPRIVTDQGGQVVSRHDYMAFGDEISAGIANRTTSQKYGALDEIRQQYTGYQRDTESGLDFAQARYYNSKQGRFTSVDPLTASANVKDPQTFNRYSYAMNSPYKFTDPLGLIASSSGANGDCGAEFSSCDGESGGIAETITPIFDWKNLSADEQRLFNNSSMSFCGPDDECDDEARPPLQGEMLFNFLAQFHPDSLAGTLNQTAQLEAITFTVDGKSTSAISFVNSITSFSTDRIEISVNPKLKSLIAADSRFSDAPGHPPSYPDSFKDNQPSKGNVQLSFSKDGRFGEVDTDLYNIKAKNLGKKIIGAIGHAAEVLVPGKTDPYRVYEILKDPKRTTIVSPNYKIKVGGAR